MCEQTTLLAKCFDTLDRRPYKRGCRVGQPLFAATEVFVPGLRTSSAHAVCCAAVSAILSLLSPATEAATHRPDYTPRVVDVSVTNPRFNGVPNLMMYRVTATVDDTF